MSYVTGMLNGGEGTAFDTQKKGEVSLSRTAMARRIAEGTRMRFDDKNGDKSASSNSDVDKATDNGLEAPRKSKCDKNLIANISPGSHF